jgi:phytoene desaturase
MNKHVVIIGAGFSGLSAAAFLAREGFEVSVIEKNTMPGDVHENFQPKDLLMIWAQAGIGCPM